MNAVAGLNPELADLYYRVTHIENPKVAYLDAGSFDKDTRKWAVIDKSKAYYDHDRKHFRRNMFLHDLHKWEQIQINTDDRLNFVTFDVDQPSLFMYPDGIAPYTVTRNKLDSKHHAAYLLKTPFYAKSDKQKRRFENEIRPQIKRLAIHLGADGRYTNVTTKNPFNDRLFNVTATGQTVPDVWHLLNMYSGELKKIETFEAEDIKDNHYLKKAYREVISQLIDHSAQNRRLLTVAKDEVQYRKNMYLFANQLDTTMGENNLDRIVEDVIDRGMYIADDLVRRQKRNSIEGHKKRYGNQVEENKLRIIDAVNTLKSLEMKPTMKNISQIVKLSVKSLERPLYSQVIREAKL